MPFLTATSRWWISCWARMEASERFSWTAMSPEAPALAAWSLAASAARAWSSMRARARPAAVA